MIYKTFDEAKDLIQEGDILLFQGQSLFSWLIKTASQSQYSHVGLASWVKNGGPTLECIEFRENKGGRSVNLATQLSVPIDIYRPINQFQTLELQHGQVITLDHKFDGRTITNCMRQYTGLPYGWQRIIWLLRFHIIGFRLFTNGKSLDDNLSNLIYPVCSTAVAHCFHKHYVDLTHNRSNARMEPADIARSPLLNYLFTVIK